MASFDEIMSRNRNRIVLNKITEEYREASSWLPFSAVKISEVFDENELELLANLIGEMQDATEENQKAALLIEKVETYSVLLVKLLNLAGIC